MNICFLSGRIITDIDFRFFFNNKKYLSIVKFEIEDYNIYNNKPNINKIFGYNEIADEIYASYEKGDDIIIVGNIENTGVKITEVYNNCS